MSRMTPEKARELRDEKRDPFIDFDAPLPAETRIALVAELARASGVAGMCGGS